MRSGLVWGLGLTLLLAVSRSPAQQLDTPDATPWHVAKVAKLNRTRAPSEQVSEPADSQFKFLHIRLNFGRKPDQTGLHRFRVVTQRGDPVGQLWGFNAAASLLVFEGDWTSLAGLYLDGLGHREPLFATHTATAAPRTSTTPTTPRTARQPDTVVTPGRADGPARTESPIRVEVSAPTAPSAGRGSVSGMAGGSVAGGAVVVGGEAAGSVAAGSVAAGSVAAGSAATASDSGRGSGQGGVAAGGGTGVGTGGSDNRLVGQEAERSGNPVASRRTGLLTTSRLSLPPPLILYLSCGEDDGHGQIFQVNEDGRVLGIVSLPYLATGLALHRDNALIAVTPRDGGRIYRIDDTGRVSVVRERDKELPYPIDVGTDADSDTIVVADSIAHALLATSASGVKAEPYLRFKRPRRDNERMSLAVTKDKHVLFGGDNDPGIFRFSGDEGSSSRPPLLRGAGGVAADTASLKWAATQEPNQICVFEGEELLKRFLLLGNKRIYRQGLLSFAPAGAVVVVARNADQAEGAPWFIIYQTEDKKDLMGNDVRVLFKWERARLVDFVVGPRMRWDRTSPSKYRSVR